RIKVRNCPAWFTLNRNDIVQRLISKIVIIKKRVKGRIFKNIQFGVILIYIALIVCSKYAITKDPAVLFIMKAVKIRGEKPVIEIGQGDLQEHLIRLIILD